MVFFYSRSSHSCKKEGWGGRNQGSSVPRGGRGPSLLDLHIKKRRGGKGGSFLFRAVYTCKSAPSCRSDGLIGEKSQDESGFLKAKPQRPPLLSSPTYKSPFIIQIRISLSLLFFTGRTNALSVRDSRYFKPSPSAFRRVPGRGPDAWRIRPGSYFLLPFRQAFGADFPSRGFTVFLSIRAAEDSEVSFFLFRIYCMWEEEARWCTFVSLFAGGNQWYVHKICQSFPSFLQTSGLAPLSLTAIGLQFSWYESPSPKWWRKFVLGCTFLCCTLFPLFLFLRVLISLWSLLLLLFSSLLFTRGNAEREKRERERE